MGDERGPGRPEVGKAASYKLGEERVARIDAVRLEGESRGGAIRRLLDIALQAEAEMTEARAEARRHLEHLRMAHPDHFEVNVIGERMCGCGGQWPCPAPDKRAERAEAAIERVRRMAQVWVDIRPTFPTATREGHTMAHAGEQVLAALDHPTDTQARPQ